MCKSTLLSHLPHTRHTVLHLTIRLWMKSDYWCNDITNSNRYTNSNTSTHTHARTHAHTHQHTLTQTFTKWNNQTNWTNTVRNWRRLARPILKMTGSLQRRLSYKFTSGSITSANCFRFADLLADDRSFLFITYEFDSYISNFGMNIHFVRFIFVHFWKLTWLSNVHIGSSHFENRWYGKKKLWWMWFLEVG